LNRSTREKKPVNQEDMFKDRAISFLKGINTGSPVLKSKASTPPEPLQLVPNDNPSVRFVRNQEELTEIGKVQA
jgi:hypothetical protein